MRKTKLIALICALLSGISSFTYGMQGESSQKDGKKLENDASIKDDKLNQNWKSIKQMINSGINNPNLKRCGEKTLEYGSGTLVTWGLLKYVGNSILFPGSRSNITNNIQIRVPLGYSIGEDLTPNADKKLSYYTLSG